MNLVQKYKHISFDLDGTLVHTVPEYRYDIVPSVVYKLAGTIHELRDVDRFWFEANRDAIIRDRFNIEPERFWKLFRELDEPTKRSSLTRAYEDVESTFQRLKQHGKHLSIITGSPQWVADMEIGKLNNTPYDYFLSIFSNKFAAKPNPASFRFALEQIGIAHTDTIYIGNSDEDAHYAKNAGVDFIYLERKEHDFRSSSYARATIHSLRDLFK